MACSVSQTLDSFFKSYPQKIYPQNTVLVPAGYPITQIFYLKEGVVRQYSLSLKGTEVTLNLYKTDSFFPVTAILNQSANPYIFETITAVKLFLAPLPAVEIFLKKNPVVTFDLLTRVYRGLDGLLLRLAYHLSANAYHRLIVELLIYSQRFGSKKKPGVQITIKEKNLAAQTGLARETISRELKKLILKNIIIYTPPKLLIPDSKLLEAELEVI